MDERDRLQRLAIAEAIEKARCGRMRRRDFLRICAQTGFGVSGLGAMTGCHRSSSPPAPEAVDASVGPRSAIDPHTEQHRFLKEVGRRFAGTTLRVVGEDTPPTHATIEIMKQEFVAVTGINVDWEQLPLDRVLAKVAADTGRKVGAFDIFYWDHGWLGRFAGDAIDPRTLLSRADLAYPEYAFDDFLPPLVEKIASYQGRLVGIPFDIPIFIMMYRKDILTKLGLSVPTSIEAFKQTARAINEAMAPSVYGTAGQWKSGHYALISDFVAWLWAHGGSVFGPEGRPTVNDDRAVAAMEYMLDLGKYMPPGVTSWDWGGEASAFARGEAGILLQAGEWFSSFDDPATSKVVGLIEPAPCPREIALRPPSQCSFDETPGISRQGGSCLAISRYSRNIDAAWVFLQWATSSDVMTRACVVSGGSTPLRMSTFSDPRVKEREKVMVGTTRFFSVTLDAILHRMGTEPHLPSWSSLAVDSFAVELGKMTARRQDVRTTLNAMAKAAELAAANR